MMFMFWESRDDNSSEYGDVTAFENMCVSVVIIFMVLPSSEYLDFRWNICDSEFWAWDTA